VATTTLPVDAHSVAEIVDPLGMTAGSVTLTMLVADAACALSWLTVTVTGNDPSSA
jgi:hypothetical protein